MKKQLHSIFLAFFAVFALGVNAQIVINEISYNHPTPNSQGKFGGVEYLELYNNSALPVDITGWSIPRTAANGLRHTFGATIVPPKGYVVITNDSVGYQSLYGATVEEYDGFILNAGYQIILEDSSGLLIDSLTYDDTAPWPVMADGRGCSIELCDPASDNAIPTSWIRATNYLGTYNNRKAYGTPGMQNSTCGNTPIVQIELRSIARNEDAGNLLLDVYISRANGSSSSVQVHAMNGSGDVATDITFSSPASINFSGAQDESQPLSVTIVDDTLNEQDETILFILKNPTNATLANDTLELTIREDPNDRPVNRHLKLAGIADEEGAGAANLVEVIAVENIPDLSLYGLGCGNVIGTNPGGSDGQEFTFPSVSAIKGKSYYITDDSAAFVAFYGFNADFIDNGGNNGAMSYNGDDPMELFENGRVIDIYGDLTVDGTGEVWEYSNGWGHRKEATGPDGTTFVPANWTFSGVDGLAGFSTNDSCAKPYPFPQDTTGLVSRTLEAKKFLLYPNPTSGKAFVYLDESVDQLQVVDLLGNLIHQQAITSATTILDLSEQKAGVYLVRVITINGESSVRRLIKE